MSDNENKEVTIEQLQAQLEEAKAQTAEARNESAQRRQALKGFEGVDVEEYNSLKSKASEMEQNKLESEGKFEEAKAAIISAKEAELSTLKEQNNKLKNKLKSVTISDKIKTTANELGAINPKNIAILLKEEITMNENGDIEIIDENGKTVFDGSGNPLTVTAKVETF